MQKGFIFSGLVWFDFWTYKALVRAGPRFLIFLVLIRSQDRLLTVHGILVRVVLFPYFNPNRSNNDNLKTWSQIFTWVTREQIIKMYTFDTFTNKDNLALIKINSFT